MYIAPHIKIFVISVDAHVLAASNNTLGPQDEKTQTLEIDQPTIPSDDAWKAQGKQNSFFDDDNAEW